MLVRFISINLLTYSTLTIAVKINTYLEQLYLHSMLNNCM